MRVEIDDDRIRRVGRALAAAAQGLKPLDFTEPRGRFPAIGHTSALDYFFGVMLHQYGFWLDSDGRYAEPVWADIGGERLKGSDIVFRGATRALEADPTIFSPARLAAWTRADLLRVFGDDHGRMPLPVPETHLELARGYGRACLQRGWTSRGIVAEANAAASPVGALLEHLAVLPGYAEDPLRKKAMLLAYALANRPERWLRAPPDDPGWGPCVDYHVQRTALRMGLVSVRDAALRSALEDRRVVAEADEAEVRTAVHEAMRRLRAETGLDDATLDAAFFESRRRCPETSEPDCPRCPAEPGCAKMKAMFQPVFRTTYY